MIDKIITLANQKVAIPFIAMERSLRATGCDLPLWVIPYDDQIFPLPPNASWIEHPELFYWLKSHHAHPSMRKYLSLLHNHYHFIDTDCIFLKNPATVLQGINGFITSCCHWHNPQDTLFHNSELFYKKQSTTWQRNVFNSGQYACTERLYDFETLKSIAENPKYCPIILKNPYNEQPGLNLLIHLSKIPIHNLTLPPYNMESTWAGDYSNTDYLNYWNNESRKPYVIHWAGSKADGHLPIDTCFFQYLSNTEMHQYKTTFLKKTPAIKQLKQRVKGLIKKIFSSILIHKKPGHENTLY
jgi:hypothetical protein